MRDICSEFKEAKTADEMFRVLGYVQTATGFYMEYVRHGEEYCRITVQDCGNMLGFIIDCGEYYAASLDSLEIAACDQLSKEWRAKKEKEAES